VKGVAVADATTAIVPFGIREHRERMTVYARYLRDVKPDVFPDGIQMTTMG
jgi:hypothetical protein